MKPAKHYRIVQCPHEDCGHIQKMNVETKHHDCSICRRDISDGISYGLDIGLKSLVPDPDWKGVGMM